ncbi:thiamine pyrophosphate-dependent enzyme [Bacteriovorax sp. Seq25_V]|uniref:2-oxoacid:acceptor oxidoreductase family protein n=1 Tax=Bacteriovorax sp. Seq25_V TaxID=1201288 RepID=UPI00038A3D79|nr:thiamine pyrophosphate-dependent enzyme [Bacteriovorax sp. Seq25_V]EQC43670.1 2-oxoacid:ferredoxin/flavodoxin oxidoreductase, gamma subunit [Bacteriovorax sp. Seq25_V]
MAHKILNGNEIIVQGGLEAGFSLYTGYPGSPLAEYFNILYAKKNEFHEKGIRVVIANSEANAAAMASGAKQAGRDCMVAMKSMGLHVASDALSVGNFANPGIPYTDEVTGETRYPGTVVVVGDDPWSMSTSTAADSRYLFKHLHISFLEPSTPQELKDWIGKALEISKMTSLYQGLVLTTFLAEGGGRVDLSTEKEVPKELINLDPSTFDLSKNVMVPPNSLFADHAMIKERFPKIKEALKKLNLDKVFGNINSEIGYISSGVIFESVKQIFEEADYLSHFSLYKLAASYPLVDDLLVPYLKGLKKLVVIEEKRGFLETEIKQLCQKYGLELEIFGKEFKGQEGFPAYGGLSFEIIRDKLEILLKEFGYKSCDSIKFEARPFGEILPRRLPTFCPGCPHRETLSLLKDLRSHLKKDGIDLITHGDVGCYSLSFLPPFKEMHNLSAMGQGGALGAGVDLFTENPSVVLMGDSTFFHSGLTDISNSLQMDHDITYILLDNDNTAMTGHQMTPASGISVEGKTRPRQNMLAVVKSLGVTQTIEVNPSDRYFYQNVMRDFIKKSGVKVIVSNKECSLTFQSKKRVQERNEIKQSGVIKEKNFYQINTLACEDCRVCVEATGCPGLTQVHDAYGTKVSIDPQICVSDSYCTKMKACPSFELVTVKNYHPSKYISNNMKFDFSSLTEPEREKTLDTIAAGTPWRMVVTGVGGSGITTISKIIANASIKMGGHDDLDFKFMDQKGLAQRNGNVTSHMSICPSINSMGAVTPIGSSDVLVSPDLLDGANQLSFLKEDGLAIFDQDYQVPLSILLDRNLDAIEIRDQLSNSEDKRIRLFPLKKWSENLLGKSVYASSMILGVAYQYGKVPFAHEDIQNALRASIKGNEVDNNLIAFELGREMVSLGNNAFEAKYQNVLKHKAESYFDLATQSVSESLLPWQKRKYILEKFKDSCNKITTKISDISRNDLITFVHDQFIFDRGQNIDEFISGLVALKDIYPDSKHFKIAARTYAKTFIIKDEVYISHQMISPLLKAMDDDRYANLGTGYGKTRINRPAFDVFGKTIEFDISPTDWMLKIMRHARILRFVLGNWHHKEREISLKIRDALFNKVPKEAQPLMSLRQLENVKGYRKVRYESAAFLYQ